MFTIVPLIIIFLCSAYIYLNDVSLITQLFIYSFELSIVVGSIYLYKKIQKDLKAQEENKIRQEITELEKKLSNTTDEMIKKGLEHKIENYKKILS